MNRLRLTLLALFAVIGFGTQAMAAAGAEKTYQVPAVSAEFLQSYDHKTPSGHFQENCKVNRLGNFGIDTRQFRSPVDFNLLADRDYFFVGETSDEGWLIGGGENDKLKRKDTGHAEVWRIGPDSYQQGGIPYQTAIQVMRAIRFAPLYLKPLRVNHTGGGELELLFGYEPESNIGQLFQTLTSLLPCPCGDYGNPFHVTLARGVKFRSAAAEKAYFAKVDQVVAEWRRNYPDGILFGNGGISFFLNREEIIEEFLPSLKKGVDVDAGALKKIPDYPHF